MKTRLRAVFLLLICSLVATAIPSFADTPSGFSWVDLEADQATVRAVREALRGVHFSAIREIGVEHGYALVMITSREPGAPTPDYDQWYVYDVSLKTRAKKLILFGYGVRLLDWIGRGQSELAISYYDCWECEAASVFTTFHFVPGHGWYARWPDKTAKSEYPQPGAVVRYGDMGEPYDDTVADYVFAVVQEPNNGFAVGNWLHSRDTKTGKIENDVYKYSVDPASGADSVQKLVGRAAIDWEKTICDSSTILIRPSAGQDSKSCKRVLRSAAKSR